jgi:alanine-synthesizing transaminase
VSGTPDEFFDHLEATVDNTWPVPRILIISFPHNPTTTCVDLAFFERLVAYARERGIFVIHDFAYADISFDGYVPPSLLQVPGADQVGVELYTLTKGHSMAGWRVGFVVGNADAIAALGKLKSYLDYGTFQPIQIASIIALNETDYYVDEVNAIYEKRRDTLIDGLDQAGWEIEAPKGTMFVWAEIPEPFAEMGSLDFAIHLLGEAKVAVSPGIGFGPTGEGYVRFALVENHQRIRQAVRGIRTLMTAV